MKVKQLRKYLRRCKRDAEVLIILENIPGFRSGDYNLAVQPIKMVAKDRSNGNVVITSSDNQAGLEECLNAYDHSQPR